MFLCCSLLSVKLGDRTLTHFELTEQVKLAIKTIRHPFYDSDSKDNDIMLVKLLTPVRINKYVKPLALPSNCPAPRSYCVLVGWGTTVLQRGRENGWGEGLVWGPDDVAQYIGNLGLELVASFSNWKSSGLKV